MFDQYANFIKADCSGDYTAIELNGIEDKHHSVLANSATFLNETRTALVQAQATLPFFAEKYNISPHMKDYVLVPTIILPSDLPNRNAVAFPLTQLACANLTAGRVAYQTFTNKPCHVEHNNSDPSKAKGIVLDSFMKKMRNVQGDIHKVIALCAFDRSRDPILANDILAKKRSSYSMGAYCEHYTCSHCGAVHNPSAGKVGCDHISVGSSKINVLANDELVFANAYNIMGFEVSSVLSPAYRSAADSPFMTLQ